MLPLISRFHGDRTASLPWAGVSAEPGSALPDVPRPRPLKRRHEHSSHRKGRKTNKGRRVVQKTRTFIEGSLVVDVRGCRPVLIEIEKHSKVNRRRITCHLFLSVDHFSHSLLKGYADAQKQPGLSPPSRMGLAPFDSSAGPVTLASRRDKYGRWPLGGS